MIENEEMEGKNLATDKKKEFEAQILEEIKDLKTGENTTSIERITVTNLGSGYKIEYNGITFGLIDKDGKFEYNNKKLKELKATLQEEGKTLDDLGLPDLEQSIDQEKEPKEEEKDGEEPEQETGDEGSEQEKDIEKDKEEIAKELEIEPKNIYPIRENSSFYEKHSGMFQGRNLFFFKDKQGNIKVGTIDENGKPIEDTEHFTSADVGKMQQVIRIGDGREDVKREIPIQMIGIRNPAKQTGQEDVQDRYIAVFIGKYGEPEFEEVEQSRQTGDLVSTRIEVSGRDYNTEIMKERIQDRSARQTPGKTSKNAASIEENEHGDDGVQPDEVFSDNDTFENQLRKDLMKTYGPMPEDKLKEMTGKAMGLIKNGEDRDKAIAKAGIEERAQGGRARGETYNPRTGE